MSIESARRRLVLLIQSDHSTPEPRGPPDHGTLMTHSCREWRQKLRILRLHHHHASSVWATHKVALFRSLSEPSSLARLGARKHVETAQA